VNSLPISPSHVALLVRSVDQSAQFLQSLGFHVGPAEQFEGEGTREIYVENDKRNSLLLMEPIKPGAYQRAMEKRGPGLHHLAIDVLSIEVFLQSIGNSGWLLHPTSLKTISHSQTAYLARPGFPALIEVQEKETLGTQDLFVSKIEIPFDASLTRLLEPIGLKGIVFPSPISSRITLGSQSVLLDSILNAGDCV
jgi:hypothetical protein